MPQPLAKVLKEMGLPDCVQIFGMTALRANPGLSMLFAQAIASYSELDATMGSWLSQATGVDAEIAMNIYTDLFGQSGAQRQMLSAAVKRKYDENDQDLFFVLRDMSNSIADRRNKLAHGLIGSSPQIPDALLVSSPSTRLRYQAQSDARSAKISERPLTEPWPSMPEYDNSLTMVWKQTDFESLIKDASQMSRRWDTLRTFVSRKQSFTAGTPDLIVQTNEQLRRQLVDEPQIRLALEKRREGRRKPS